MLHPIREVYATDIDALTPHYGALAGPLADASATPTTTMLQVSRLAISGQLVEFDGIEVA